MSGSGEDHVVQLTLPKQQARALATGFGIARAAGMGAAIEEIAQRLTAWYDEFGIELLVEVDMIMDTMSDETDDSLDTPE